MKEKFSHFLSTTHGKAITLASVMSCPALVFAEGETSTNGMTEVTAAIKGSFSVADITTVITSILTAGIGFYLTWWCARKVFKGVKGAFSKGKLSI